MTREKGWHHPAVSWLSKPVSAAGGHAPRLANPVVWIYLQSCSTDAHSFYKQHKELLPPGVRLDASQKMELEVVLQGERRRQRARRRSSSGIVLVLLRESESAVRTQSDATRA